ncbi:pitrilysin family protein [Sphingomonas sp. HF-S4]|uniref:Pitrilysin family protein n=1 Tax=Sphingomonas agrestis TaxID=3080540 RepID=A0ABU3Y6T7_9SPHN|nr:pitrilysin family protein [Sphingomonas sp. HF-S4]MDV3456877.1 pitrilysin family protein [Sphingomonas sp. HF-S4]
MKSSKLLLAAAALALAAAQPAVAQELAPYQQFTLANGLRVVVHEDHNTPKVAVSVWYHVGSMNEPQGKSGFAHLFEHLMFNGSEHHDKEYMPPLQEVGVSQVNGATAFDQTWYYEIVPTGGLERVLWLESDRMGYLLGAVTQAKLDEQRAVVQNEKRTRENQPYAMMSEKTGEGVFPHGHPYHHSIIGSMEDLNAASLDDVKSWFREYYGASNAVVTLSGDVTLDQAKKLMEKYFGSIPAGPPTGRTTAWVPVLDRDKSEVMQEAVPETAIAWNWPVPGRGTAEAPALRMAAQILGRGKTSRLYQALVRDQQIATSASATYGAYAVAGTFTVDVRLKPGVDRVQAEVAVKAVLADFLAKGPSVAELERTKTSSYADTARSMESIYVKAMALSDGALFANNPGQYRVEEARFAAVTAPEVRSIAGSWLAKPNYRLTVLPFGTRSVVADSADRTKLPPLGPSPELKLPGLREARLSNGIRVVLSERPGTPTVEMAMVFDAGAAAEQHMKRGLQGFTLGMMDEGTVKLGGQAFAEKQAMLGARIWATGDSDTADFALSALPRALPETVALWADYIRNPGFRAEDLERDRALHLSGLSQSLSDPGNIAERTFGYLLYGADHAYGVPLAGRAETIKSLSREDLIAFHENWIRPDTGVIYASGNTDMATLTAALEKAFGDWKTPARAKGVKTLDPVAGQAAPRVVLVDKPGAIQSVIRVGQIMPTGLEAGDFELRAMNDVLGGGFTARLNMNLREGKGWTYGANSYLADARGPQVFGVATNIQTDKTAEALSEIDKEIRGIRAGRPATRAELDLLTKGQVLSLPGQFETNQAMVGYLQYINRYGKPYDHVTTLPRRYAALTPETITANAATIRPEGLTWVIVGDLAKVEAKIRALKLGPVEVWDAEGRKLR